MFGQVGSFCSRVSQCLNALSLHWSIHSGSCFFAEIIRTIPSFRPRGTVSASMSVTNPYLYSRFASDSIVFVSVAIFARVLGIFNQLFSPGWGFVGGATGGLGAGFTASAGLA